MLLIAHRGNIHGKEEDNENKQEYILEAINQGYDVEVDVWLHNDALYLGHDGPQYLTDIKFLKNDKLWCHCKNVDVLQRLIENKVHCFFHKSDDIILTSKGYMWTFPKKKLVKGSICVMPEYGYQGNISDCIGICSDFIGDWRDYEG